jgi:hypothetical protein
MGNYEIAVLVGWAIAVWALCSVLFSDPAKFTALGRSKGRWFLVALAAFIPYFGFIAALFYLVKVRVRFPPRVRQPRPARPASGGGAPAPGYGNSHRAAPMPNNPMGSPPVQTCTSCGGSGKQMCFACQGRGRITNPAYAPHAGTSDGWCSPCGGSGKRNCDSCGGSGKRR